MFTGISAGRYEVAPEYEGGVVGPATAITIQRGVSSAVWLQANGVGGVAIDVSAELCAAVKQIRVARHTVRESSVSRASEITQVAVLSAPSECRSIVAGLAPGRYSVEVTGTNGRTATANAEVEAEAISEVSLGAPPIHISGRVTLHGRPFSGDTIEIVGPSPERKTYTASIDPAGFYSVDLASTGTYKATLLRDRRVIRGQQKEFTVGASGDVVDWDIAGGALEIDVTNRDWRNPITVSLASTAKGAGTISFQVGPNDKLPLLIPGLPYGSYSIRARDGAGRVAEPVTKALDEKHAEASVSLMLDQRQLIVQVRSPSGIAASPVSFNLPATEISPGEYSIVGPSRGTALKVGAAGFAPACRLVSDQSLMVFELAEAAEVELVFSRKTTGPPPGSIAVPGSDCRLRLSELSFKQLPDDETGRSRFLFPSFPVDRVTYIWEATGAAQPVALNGGRALIKLPPIKAPDQTIR